MHPKVWLTAVVMAGVACSGERVNEPGADAGALEAAPDQWAGAGGASGVGGVGVGGVGGAAGCTPKPPGGEGGGNFVFQDVPPENEPCPVEGLQICTGLGSVTLVLSACLDGKWATLSTSSDCTPAYADCHGWGQPDGECCEGARFCEGVGLCDGTRWWVKGWICHKYGTPCTDSDRCCEESSCANGVCAYTYCTDSTQCTAPMVCHANGGICGYADCHADSECEQPLRCQEHQCKYVTCSQYHPCEAPLVCVNGLCKVETDGGT